MGIKHSRNTREKRRYHEYYQLIAGHAYTDGFRGYAVIAYGFYGAPRAGIYKVKRNKDRYQQQHKANGEV